MRWTSSCMSSRAKARAGRSPVGVETSLMSAGPGAGPATVWKAGACTRLVDGALGRVDGEAGNGRPPAAPANRGGCCRSGSSAPLSATLRGSAVWSTDPDWPERPETVRLEFDLRVHEKRPGQQGPRDAGTGIVDGQVLPGGDLTCWRGSASTADSIGSRSPGKGDADQIPA